jgi:sporulation protein YqfC
MNGKSEKKIRKNGKTEPKRSIAERMGGILDIPADLLCGGCYMELRGQSELKIQGCRRIVGYTAHEIVLRLRRGIVRIGGRDMRCVSYHGGCVTVGGWIESVIFGDSEESV